MKKTKRNLNTETRPMSTCLQLINTFWEGVFAVDFTLDQIERRCIYLGETLLERGQNCLVAYDARFMSNLFARNICHILQQQGVQVYLASMPAPLPAIQHALSQQEVDCALVVSARNKPYWYNGLVLLNPSLSDDLNPPSHWSPRQASASLLFIDPVAQAEKTDAIPTIELRTPYLEHIRKHIDVAIIQRSTMTIFVDPMHGTLAGYLPSVIGEESQTMAISINREPDPLFDRLTPLPAVSNLTRLRKLVRESDSHVGLAFSADGTALGIVDKNGTQLDRTDITLLLADYLVRQYRQKGLVIAPPPLGEDTISMAGIETWKKSLGIDVEITSHASERIAEMLQQKREDLLVGCTPEGELVIGHYILYPDALLAGLLVVEMIARSGRTLQFLLEQLRASIAAP